jgi:4-hydroxy 2-oxovalerate aldolase
MTSQEAALAARRLDVTLRDGAFPVHFRWSPQDAQRVVEAAGRTGCEFVEVGYLGGPPDAHGMQTDMKSAAVDRELVARLAESAHGVKLLAMLHPTVSVTRETIRGVANAGLFGVRMVYHPSWAAQLSTYAKVLAEHGLWVSINIALVSHYRADDLARTGATCALLSPDALYLADTSAGLFPTELDPLVAGVLAAHNTVGVHMHDHLGLALANSISGVLSGASLIDYSIAGLGRGAGNLRAELWCALRSAGSGDWTDVIDLVVTKQELAKRWPGLIRPMSQWPQLISGLLNLTPPEEDDLVAAVDSGHETELGELIATLEHLSTKGSLVRRCSLRLAPK